MARPAQGRGSAGRATRALEVLAAAAVAHRVHEYDPDAAAAEGEPSRARDRRERPHYGARTAAALGVDPDRIFKTLVASVDGRLAVGIVPVSGELDLKALAAAVGGRRATMADPAEAERATGYVVGGISPLGQRRALPTILDGSAMEHATILVSAGRRGMQVELAPADLAGLLRASVAPIWRRG